MISCTEFIPAYSELFTFLEKKNGKKEVEKFWDYLFTPDGKGIPLINFISKEGIKGCFTYWAGSLNEEAADFTMYVNEKRGFFHCVMHRCPSKGRLLELQKEIGVKPYSDYCLHCDYYRKAVEKIGLKYIYNFTGVDKASCSILIYDPKIFDGRVIIDSDTIVMDRRASDNEYFHKDFHSSLNMAIDYLAENYGVDVLEDYFDDYVSNVYQKTIIDINERGLKAVEDKILDTYLKEKSVDAIETKLDGNKLTVKVNYCPAVKHLKETGRQVTKHFIYSTSLVMKKLAEKTNLKFNMLSYDNETGKAEYEFIKE
ncbi:MAG: hypothetical protein IKA85_00865 [Clostridia bacterium]|nr:hypothetical protein [Clostridia bacterium]